LKSDIVLRWWSLSTLLVAIPFAGYIAGLLAVTSPVSGLQANCDMPAVTSTFLEHSIPYRNAGLLVSAVLLIGMTIGFRISSEELTRQRISLFVSTISWSGALVFTMAATLALHILPVLKCVHAFAA